MKRETDIAYTDDIIDEVAIKLGIPRAKVMHHMDFMVHWIKTLTRDPQILSIYIPHIGTLYLNWSMLEKDHDRISKYSDKDLTKNLRRRIEDDEERLVRFKQEFEGIEGHIRHKKRFKLFNPHFTKGMSLEELENWQNK